MMDLQHLPQLSDVADLQVVAMGGGKSPVDLDATTLIYLVFFLLAWFLLNKFLFQPYLAVRDRREQRIGGARGDADAMKRDADALLSDYERRLEEARHAAAETRTKLRREGEAEQKAIMEKAYGAAAKDLQDRRAELNTQVESARKELRKEAETLSQLIVKRLLPS